MTNYVGKTCKQYVKVVGKISNLLFECSGRVELKYIEEVFL